MTCTVWIMDRQCGEPATHKVNRKDGTTGYICAEHARNWGGLTPTA